MIMKRRAPGAEKRRSVTKKTGFAVEVLKGTNVHIEFDFGLLIQ